MIPAAPNKPVAASRNSRARRPDFRGRRHEGSMHKSIAFGSPSSSVSSGWLYTGPEIEAQVAPYGPAHPSQEAADETERIGGGICCIPSSLLSEKKVKDKIASARADPSPEWGCFRPVVLPSKVSSTHTHFHQDSKTHPDDGGGRTHRFDVPASLAKQAPGGSPRAREQATALSSALRRILYGVRSSSRPGRVKLANTMADVTNNETSQALHLSSGARMGLQVISALEDVVTDEGEVFETCFRQLVWQARCACRQRGQLMEVMRRHYASLFAEVVEHLSQLKSSLEDTISEEERLKQQAYRVQRLAKLLAEDAKINDDYRRKLAATPPTELERYIAARIHPTTAKHEPAGGVVGAPTNPAATATREADNGRNSDSGSTKCDTSNGDKPAQRESVESLVGVLSEVRSESRTEPRNSSETTDRTRHVMAAMKVDMLQDMIDERVAAKREQERREQWRQYNAATTIKNWWRKVNPPAWEEADRQYAATLIQAHTRGMMARLKRKRFLEHFRATKGAIALQNVFRRYLAIRERRRRARVVQLALGAGLRTLDNAVGNLEAKVSALQAPGDQGARTPPPGRTSIAATAASEKQGIADAAVNATGREQAKEEAATVSTLVGRLKALAELWEERRGRNHSEEFGGEDSRGSRHGSIASSQGAGRRATGRRRRH